MVTRYICRHPLTGEPSYLSNQEWRCLKVGLPIHSGIWQLLAAEKEYRRMLVCVAERNFEPALLAWLVAQLETWPKHVLSTPSKLQRWYWHMSGSINIDTHTRALSAAAAINAKLAELEVDRKKLVLRAAKRLERGIKLLEKMNRKKRIAKLRRGR